MKQQGQNYYPDTRQSHNHNCMVSNITLSSNHVPKKNSNNLPIVYIAFTSWQTLVSEFKLDWNYEPRVHNAMFPAVFSRPNTVPGTQYMLSKQPLFTQRKVEKI